MPMWPDAKSTSLLIDRAQSGDAEAAGQLLAGHRAALRRLIALRLDPVLRRRVDASDVVQDVLIEANRRLPDYLADARLPFHLWLRQIARDRLIDAHRRHRQAARRSLDREQPLAAYADRSSLDLAAQLRDNNTTPAAAAIRGELRARFLAALESLEEIDREMLSMRHLEQLTNQACAELLGLSQQAAAMRYLRAIKRLRARLEQAPSDSMAR